jgi:hypothetical protein
VAAAYARLGAMTSCVLCGASGDRLTDEDVIPKWALRALNVQGPITIGVREETAEQQHVGKRRSFKVVLDNGLCPTCNNVRLSQLENEVKPILAPMAVEHRPTTLTAASQQLLATWAVKTVFLLELAIRQKYPGTRPVEGYLATGPEMAWMFANLEPPPRSMVWLGSWDCQREVPLNYAPSSASLPTRDRQQVEGTSPRSPSDTWHSRSSRLTSRQQTGMTLTSGTPIHRHRWHKRSHASGRSSWPRVISIGRNRRSGGKTGTCSSTGTVHCVAETDDQLMEAGTWPVPSTCP